ncbi:MAG: hypothetical protein QXO51_00035 [Halobacteria archaeon]
MLLTPMWLSLLAVLWLGARGFGYDLTSEALLGFLVGLGWEAATRDLWVYRYPKMWVVRSIPVAVVAGWAFTAPLASFVGQLMVPLGTWSPRTLLADAMVSAAIPGGFELLFGYVLHYWEYRIQKPWYVRIGSWVCMGTGLLTVMRAYSPVLDGVLGIG